MVPLVLLLLFHPSKGIVSPYPSSVRLDENRHCMITDTWRQTLKEINHYFELYSAGGCEESNSVEKHNINTDIHLMSSSSSQSSTVSYEIGGEDTGYDNHLQVRSNWTDHIKCVEVAKKNAYTRAALLSSSKIPRGKHFDTRVVLFAGLGCLHNRETWSKVRDEELAPHIAVFSDCAIGRFFREGVDMSIPTLPYPDLIRYECGFSSLMNGVFGTDTQFEKLTSPLPHAPTNFYFSGSPTAEVRRHFGQMEGSIINVGSSKTKYISKMTQTERNWTCVVDSQTLESNKHADHNRDCDCLLRAAQHHYHQLTSTKFGLVPRGHGVYSFRLVEVMLSGAIPVIFSNGWVLPFHDALNWDAFSIRVDEFEVSQSQHGSIFDKILSEVSPECIELMRERSRHVAVEYLSSLKGMNRAIGAIMASRSLGCRKEKYPKRKLDRDKELEQESIEESKSSFPQPSTSSFSWFFDKSDTLEKRRNAKKVEVEINDHEFNKLGLKNSPFREDVSQGTADVCLPQGLRYARIKPKSMKFESGHRVSRMNMDDFVIYGKRDV